jgi:hypothetical protein
MQAVTLLSPGEKQTKSALSRMRLKMEDGSSELISAMCNIRIVKQPHSSLASNRGSDQKQVLPDKMQLQ